MYHYLLFRVTAHFLSATIEVEWKMIFIAPLGPRPFPESSLCQLERHCRGIPFMPSPSREIWTLLHSLFLTLPNHIKSKCWQRTSQMRL